MGAPNSKGNNFSSNYSFNACSRKYSVYNGRDMRALATAAEKEIRSYYEKTLYPYLISKGITSEVIMLPKKWILTVQILF